MNEKGPNTRMPMGRWQKIRRETVGMGAAEFVSSISSIGTVALLEDLAPNLTKKATHLIAKHVFMPYLDYAEETLGYVCRLKECQADKTKSREERAENLARATMLFIPANIVSWGFKIGTRKLTNKFMKVEDHVPEPHKWWELHKALSPKDWMIVGLDEGAHLGALWTINAGVPEIGDGMIKSTEKVFRRLGFSEQRSKDMASMLVIWEVPNAVGFAAGLGGVYAHHAHGAGSHMERIIEQSMKSARDHLKQ